MKKETREGYKFTELGEMPIEWTIKSIDELIEENIILEVMDGNHGAIHPKSSDYTKRGIPFIMANNFSKGRIDVKNCKYISRDLANTLRKGFAIEGDVLLTHKGTLGETAIVPSLENGFIVLTPQVTYYRVSKNNKLLNKYLKIYFDSKYFQDSLKSLGSQSTRDYVGITEQKKMKIVLPQIKEQEKIAEILSVVDEQIENTERLIQKNQKLKKGLMQQLLTKGIGHTEFKKTELGYIPKKWEIKKLKEICDVKGGKRLPKGFQLEDEENGLPYIRVADMYMGGVKLNDIKYVPFGASEKMKNYKISKKDLFISVAGTLGIVGEVPNSLDGANLTENADKLCNITINKKFLLKVLQSEFVQNIIESEKTSNAQPKLALTRIKEFLIPVPTIEEQKKISSILVELDKKIEKYKYKKENLEELKKGLMQQLLTGKIRVV